MAGTQSMLPFPYLNTYIEAICFKISSNSNYHIIILWTFSNLFVKIIVNLIKKKPLWLQTCLGLYSIKCLLILLSNTKGSFHTFLTSSLLVVIKLLDPMETSKCQPCSSPQGEVLCLGDNLRGVRLYYTEERIQRGQFSLKRTCRKMLTHFCGRGAARNIFCFNCWFWWWKLMVKMIEKHIANCFSKLIKIHNLFLERVSWRLVSNLGAESQELVHLCIFT